MSDGTIAMICMFFNAVLMGVNNSLAKIIKEQTKITAL